MVTKPSTLGQAAERLIVNYRANQGGSIRAAIKQPNGQEIAGYTLPDCKPLRGDSLQQHVAWKDGGDIRHLRGNHPVVRLEFELKNADLFSLQFKP